MYRAVELSGTVYATECRLDSLDERENIESFASQATIVVISDDLDLIAEIYNIEVHEIILT